MKPVGKRKDGAALGMVLIVILVVSLMGAGLLNLSGAAGFEASRDLSQDQAFWLAEAGLEEAKTKALKNWQIDGDIYSLPAGTWSSQLGEGSFQVTVTDNMTTPPSFEIISEGTSQGGTLQAVALGLNQVSALTVGVFGDQAVNLKPNTSIYSYYSSSGTEPTPEDSTGEASVGSNSDISLLANPGFVLDGEIKQGADPLDEQDAELDFKGSGADNLTVSSVGHLDPDPLGLFKDASNPLNISGDYDNAAAGFNDNASVSNIIANQLLLGTGSTGTLSSGSYFLSEVELVNNSTLEIDASSGPVTIYLSGSMEADTGSEINLINGDAVDFRIFARGSTESGDQIWLQPNQDFKGFIYAPKMLAHIQPSGDFEGVVWANEAEIWPGGQIFVDMSMMEYNAFAAYSIEWNSWRQVPR